MAAERSRDLYPLMTLEYVVKALKVLFGRDNVISDLGDITVRFNILATPLVRCA